MRLQCQLTGDFKNAGRAWRPSGEPEEVRVHDFLDKNLGKAIPYGVYDMINNQGWVSVGIDHDTAQFAVNSIRRWWKRMGLRRFPRATKLRVTADGGGSNSSRSRLWKVSLQALADELDLRLHVCHFLSAGYEQVEQDRASTLQLHDSELARTLTDKPSHGCEFDGWYDDEERSDRQGSPGHQPIRDRSRSHPRTTESTPMNPTSIPWRLELSTDSTKNKLTRLFLSAPQASG